MLGNLARGTLTTVTRRPPRPSPPFPAFTSPFFRTLCRARPDFWFLASREGPRPAPRGQSLVRCAPSSAPAALGGGLLEDAGDQKSGLARREFPGLDFRCIPDHTARPLNLSLPTFAHNERGDPLRAALGDPFFKFRFQTFGERAFDTEPCSERGCGRTAQEMGDQHGAAWRQTL